MRHTHACSSRCEAEEAEEWGLLLVRLRAPPHAVPRRPARASATRTPRRSTSSTASATSCAALGAHERALELQRAQVTAVRRAAGDDAAWAVTFFADYVATLRSLDLAAEARAFFGSLVATNLSADVLARAGGATAGPLASFLAARVRDTLLPWPGLEADGERVLRALAAAAGAASPPPVSRWARAKLASLLRARGDAAGAAAVAPELVDDAAGWRPLADEGAAFSLAEPAEVRFGVGPGSWVRLALPAGAARATAAHLGCADPAPGVVKFVEVRGDA